MITIDPEHFRQRVLQDCLTEATAQYWERRAAQFEDAAPRAGDYPGNATLQQAAETRRIMMATALNCRRHAALIREAYPEPISDEVREALT